VPPKFHAHGVLTASTRIYSLHAAATITGQGLLVAPIRIGWVLPITLGTVVIPYGLGHGVLSAVAGKPSTTNITGTGVLTATTRAQFPALLHGHGVLSATASVLSGAAARPALAGNGVLSATTTPARTAYFHAHGSLTATPVPKIAAAITGRGALTAAAGTWYAMPYTLPFWLGYVWAAALHGRGALTAVAGEPARPALAGHGTLTGAPRNQYPAALHGHGALTATTVTLSGGGAQPALAGTGALTCTTMAVFKRPEPFHGHGQLAAAARMYSIQVAATLVGNGLLDVWVQHTRTATITGRGQLTVAAAPPIAPALQTLNNHVVIHSGNPRGNLITRVRQLV
jgi:hypothetical protein